MKPPFSPEMVKILRLFQSCQKNYTVYMNNERGSQKAYTTFMQELRKIKNLIPEARKELIAQRNQQKERRSKTNKEKVNVPPAELLHLL
jgi:hypothetical protein